MPILKNKSSVSHYIWYLAFIFSGLMVILGCSDQSPSPTTTPIISATATKPAPTATFTATATRVVAISTPVETDTPTPSASATPLPTPTSTPDTSILTLWHNLPPNQAANLQKEISQFNQNYPDITIEANHYDDAQILAAAIIDGRVTFDLVLGPSILLSPLQKTGRIAAINDLFPSRMLDSYIDSVLTGATSDGKVWGLPDTAGFHLLLFYNADLIQKPPDTETEMQALAQLLQGDDEAGLVVNSQDPIWLLPWVWAYGSWIVDDQGQAQLESEAMTKALSLYLQWHNSKPPVAPLLSHVEARDQFMNGQAALMIDGEWAIAELTQHNDISWKVAPLPDITDAERSPAPLILGRYWAINTDLPTKKAKTAITFLETVTAPQRQIEWLRVFGVLPTQRAALGGQINADNPALQISLQQLQNGQGVPLHTNLNAILDAMRTPLRQMLAGNLTPEEAATLMQDTFR